jgi:geranylgeranyl reductase family protein
VTVDVEVLVVGGGPAGAAAATTLAQHGRDVLVVDKATFPRDKCCGDGLTTLALRLLADLGFDRTPVASWQPVTAIHLRAPGGRVVDLQLPDGRGLHAAVARRADIDTALLRHAAVAGAVVAEGVAFRGATDNGDHVAVELDGHRDVRAGYVVGADGMWSPVRKALGRTEAGYRGDWHAFRQYLTGAGPAARDLWVWFDPDLLPGYAWSFPLPDGGVNVGFGVPRRSRLDGHALAAQWRALFDRPHIRAVLGEAAAEAPHRAWPIPARLPRVELTAAAGRALFVGDAATAADPMTGEGIGQALETGILAARSIIDAGAQRPDAAADAYRREVRRSLRADHRLAATLSGLLCRPRLADAALAAVDVSGWTRAKFARWMFEDEPRAAIFTPRRWHRRFLRRPGARL